MLTLAVALLLAHVQPSRAAVPSQREGSTIVARVDRGSSIALRLSPGGQVVAVAGARTSFGSPSVFSVVGRQGRWIAVRSPDLPNGRVAWIDSHRGLSYQRTAYEIEVDLSRRLLVVRDRSGATLRATIGIGAAGSPTPAGRYAITDKLRGRRYGSAYGCCILALSGNQTRLPSGWVGGTRLAIHGTNSPATIGAPASAGCLHASDAVLHRLERMLPLGTPVVIHL